jgi:hypothetical protein
MGLLAFGGRGLMAKAAPAVNLKTRPPGACNGWADTDGNGNCDRSEISNKPSEKALNLCDAVKCPGHAKNAGRVRAKKEGAPVGSCALWKDSGKKGFCSVSAESDNPCLYAACPGHKSSAGMKV